MKSIARSIVWLSGIDNEIRKNVRSCQQCQYNQKSFAAVSVDPWEWAKRPWAHSHIDQATQFQSKILCY